MATELKIPSLGQGMSEGTLIEWFVADGAEVSTGDLLYALESEKSVQEIEAPVSGIVKRVGQEGEVYPVGEVIGSIE